MTQKELIMGYVFSLNVFIVNELIILAPGFKLKITLEFTSVLLYVVIFLDARFVYVIYERSIGQV